MQLHNVTSGKTDWLNSIFYNSVKQIDGAEQTDKENDGMQCSPTMWRCYLLGPPLSRVTHRIDSKINVNEINGESDIDEHTHTCPKYLQ